VEKNAAEAVLVIARAVADAIKEAGDAGVPSGYIYATIMGVISLNNYNALIAQLKQLGLVSEENHVLRWIGPK
jgi:hypothetical protein